MFGESWFGDYDCLWDVVAIQEIAFLTDCARILELSNDGLHGHMLIINKNKPYDTALLSHRRHEGRRIKHESSDFGVVAVLGRSGKGCEITIASAHLPNSSGCTDARFANVVADLYCMLTTCTSSCLLLGM